MSELALASFLIGTTGLIPEQTAAAVTALGNSPMPAGVTARQHQSLSLTRTNPGDTVVWSADGVPAGYAQVGTIGVKGNYQAPAQVGARVPVLIIAQVGAAAVQAPGRLSPPTAPAVTSSLAISPASASLLANQYQGFTLAGANPADTVIWRVNGVTGGNAQVGTITTKGYYHAPAQVSAAINVVVTAQDGSVVATATVGLLTTAPPPPPQVAVSLLPQSVSVVAGKTQPFTAIVTGTSNTAVTWAVNGVAGGTVVVGTVSAGGLYTAPLTVPAASVAVSATSVADTTKSSSATITLLPPLEIVTSSLPAGTAGAAYKASLTATGGVAPYTWSIVTGQVPAGLSLSTVSGEILGTPTTAGSYTVSVKVTDAAGYHATVALTIVIASCTSCSPLGITTTSLPAGTVGSAYSATLAAIGGTSPYTWSISAGQLPTGFTIAPATAAISGTASSAGSYSFTVLVTDSSSPHKTASQALVCTITAPAAQLRAGGLSSYFTPTNSANLLSNPDFESGWTGWHNGQSGASSFTIDSSVHHSGSASLNLTFNASGGTVQQTLSAQPGTYDFTAWINYSNLSGGGGRVCVYAPPSYPFALIWQCTTVYTGTASGWVQVSLSKLVLSSSSNVLVSLEGYGSSTGTFWVDDVSLTQEQTPISVFMQYPNFKGMIFGDQSETAVFNVAVTPPDGAMSDYRIDGTVATAGGTTVLTGSWAAGASVNATFNFAGLVESSQYNVTFQLTRSSDGSNAGTYPHYTVYKYPASVRTGLNISTDQNQRILYGGNPVFVLGVYDSAMGYTSTQAAWDAELRSQRRLFDLPINFYLNYWYGAAGNAAIVPLIQDLQSHGIGYIDTANCTGNYLLSPSAFWLDTASKSDVQTRAATPGYLGVYRADECTSNAAGDVFSYKARTDSLVPGGISLGTMLGDNSLPLWRDAVDVLATDPYPLYGSQPTAGYDLSKVATWTASATAAVQNSRPVMTTIQFFQATGNSRWPTHAELRNMSYMAIASGANGLLYWSLGGGALAYICGGGTVSDAYSTPVGLVGNGYSGSVWLPGAGTVTSVVINSGSLPPGLSVNSSGIVTGTPTTAGTYDVNVTLNGSHTGWNEIIIQSAWTSNYPNGSNGWCSDRVANFSNFVNVVTELSGLQSPLSQVDDTTDLTGNTLSGSIRTRVKSYGGYKYLIASNTTNGTLTPSFTWHSAPTFISVYSEGRNITPSGATFTDSFGPYQAHVYQIVDPSQ
jgi:hypothetical protein